MTHGLLLNQDWPGAARRLGGAAVLKESAENEAFLRGREFDDPIGMPRAILAYRLGDSPKAECVRRSRDWACALFPIFLFLRRLAAPK